MALKNKSVHMSIMRVIFSVLRDFLLLCVLLFSHSFITACGFQWASLLYFSWIKTQVCCLSVLSASGTYYTGMGAQAWIIRITGGLVEGKWFIVRLIIANSPFTRITPDRPASGLSLHYKRLSLPQSFRMQSMRKIPRTLSLKLLWYPGEC